MVSGTRMFISDLKPGTDYDIAVQSKARHQNQCDAWDPHDPYLCKELSTIISFRTGHPPLPPTEFSVIGGTTKSIKLAWNEPILRGVKVIKFLLIVTGPIDNPLTISSDSLSSMTKSFERKLRTKKTVITNSGSNDSVPRVCEISADTVIYEVKNLSEKTEYFFSLLMITPHSNSNRVKELYDSAQLEKEIFVNDIWTPYVTTSGYTAAISPPENFHVTCRKTNSIHLSWKPAKAYGMYVLLHNIIRWSELEDEEHECLSSREKVFFFTKFLLLSFAEQLKIFCLRIKFL